MLSFVSPPEIARKVAERVREQRLARGWTQAEIAERAGVSAPTYILFERTGRIAFLRLIRVFTTLGLEAQLEALAASPQIAARSIDEITAPKRIRGRARRQRKP
jgi:transcriptional regulator with XRE-family HTH domain